VTLFAQVLNSANENFYWNLGNQPETGFGDDKYAFDTGGKLVSERHLNDTHLIPAPCLS
jgi:hypothetical protein